MAEDWRHWKADPRAPPWEELDQVEGVEEHGLVDPVMPEAVETGDAGLLVTGNRLAVEDAGARAQLGQSLDDQRELPRQVVARPAIEPHSRAVLAGDHPEAVMLDFMQPHGAGGRSWGFCGQARLDEAGGQNARTQRGHGPNLGMAEAGVKLNQRH